MLFNSFDFLFFFPIVAILYYCIAHKYRAVLLLGASYFFYFYWEPSLVLLLLASTIVDYYCAIKIHQEPTKKRRKVFLFLSIGVNLSLLFFFKYFGFFTDTAMAVLNFFGIDFQHQENMQSYHIEKILLPVGISFYTFQTLSYTIDVYRKDIKPEVNFVKYALYVSFFPQLVAGPIERANRLIPQFYKKIKLNIPKIKEGLVMMAWGFFLKIVVADRLGIYADIVYASPESFKGIPLILGMLFFGFQLYYDFSAYTAIAIGAAKILGFDLMHNFNRPMYSKRLSEFWRKWHISLMLWLKDYLYIPLQKRKVSPMLSALIIFFIVGLWHGANWTFVVWGLLSGLFLIIEIGTEKFRMKWIKKLGIPRKLSQAFWYIIGMWLIFGSTVFFRAPNFQIAIAYFSNIFKFENLGFNVLHYSYEFYITIVLLVFVQIIHYYKGNDKVHELILLRPKPIRWMLYLAFIGVIVLLSINRQNLFIYFQF